MIKDRGNIKWVAMMLPEHVEMVKGVWAENDKIPKPTLDEQELEEINQMIYEAMEYNSEVTITYYTKGELRFEIGYIHFADVMRKEIRVKDKFEEIHRFKFEDIVKVQIN